MVVLRRALSMELLIIGLMCVVLNVILFRVLTGKFPGYEPRMIIGSFLMGVILHFVLEVTGMNEQWCRTTFH
jgi:hypothetical protein